MSFSRMVIVMVMVIVLWGVDRILGMGMEFRDRIMLYCFRELKCQQQSYTLRI